MGLRVRVQSGRSFIQEMGIVGWVVSGFDGRMLNRFVWMETWQFGWMSDEMGGCMSVCVLTAPTP